MSKIYTIICLLFVSIANIQAQGNVGIGTNTPDASAKLDISSTDKGLLIPRVSLTNASTFGLSGATSTAGMMVYNTNAAMTGGYGVGFYYWTGTWNKVATGNPIQAVLNNGQILIGDASNVPTANTMSGDATLSNAGVLDLSNGAVETSEIADGAVTTIKINDGAVTTAKINDVAVTTIKIADNNVDGTKINLTGNANGDLMYYNGTDWVRLASGTTGQILQTNAGAAPTWSNPNDLFVFENGLTETAPNIVRLGGTLTQATTITQGNYNMVYNLSGTGDFDIQDNGTSALFVKDDGNVGINNNNPTQKLYVNGSTNGDYFYYSNSGISVFNAEGSTGEVRLGAFWDRPGVYSSTDLQLFSGGNATNIIFGNNNSEKARITGAGFLGIGTTAPIQNLDINGRVHINNGVLQRGGAAITNTSDLGLYSRVNGNWIRIVSNAAPIKFFVDDGAGTTDQFAIQNDGRLSWTFGESSGTQLLPDAFCVIVPRNVTCPTNWDAREVKWDTADVGNADAGKDGRIAWDDGSSSSVRMRFCCRGSGW